MSIESGKYLTSRVRYEPPEDGLNMAQELIGAFKRHASRTLLVDTESNREYTGAQILDKTGRIASGLIKLIGVRPNQVVLVMCDRNDNAILFVLGAVLAGGALYGANPADGYEDISTLCQLVKPDVIATSSRCHHMVMELRRNIEGLQEAPIIWVDDPSAKTQAQNGHANHSNGRPDTDHHIHRDQSNNNVQPDHYRRIIKQDQVVLFADLIGQSFDRQLIEQVTNKGIIASEHNLTFMLTSGSTGRPKVVPSTHEALICGLYSMKSSNRFPIGSADRIVEMCSDCGGDDDSDGDNDLPTTVDRCSLSNNQRADHDRLLLPISAESVFAGDLPLDHGAGVNTMFLSLTNGSKFIVMPSYNEDSFWQAVHDHRITSSISSTTFAYKLLRRLKTLIEFGQARERWDLSCFRWLTCCGSKMAFVDLVRDICQEYKNLAVCQSYGATEIGFITSLCIDESRKNLEPVGHLFPGLKAKVVDRDTGLVLGPNERGELLLWARSKFSAYRCHKDDDADMLIALCHDEEGFYKTGDQAHYDEEGRFYIHGRFKDTLYLVEDWMILPAELEAVINKHPLVEYSAVIGLPNEDLPGCDKPRAFVKLVAPDLIDEGESDEQRNAEQLLELKAKLIKGDRDFIAADIYQFAAERTAEPKHLKGGVIILDEFPRVGLLNKIDRKALRQIE